MPVPRGGQSVPQLSEPNDPAPSRPVKAWEQIFQQNTGRAPTPAERARIEGAKDPVKAAIEESQGQGERQPILKMDPFQGCDSREGPWPDWTNSDGRLHGDPLDRVPDHWTTRNIQDAIDDARFSLDQRRHERESFEQRGEEYDEGHRNRILDEEMWLDQLQEEFRRRGGSCPR